MSFPIVTKLVALLGFKSAIAPLLSMEALAGQETTIGEMTPLGRNLAADDKVEIETAGGVGRFATGQQLINLGGLGPASNISIPDNGTQAYGLTNLFPKVIRVIFGVNSKIILPRCDQAASPNKSISGKTPVINLGPNTGLIYDWGTNGTDGDLITSIDPFSGIEIWNDDNSTPAGDWHAIDYVTPQQIERFTIGATTDDVLTTILAIPVAAASQLEVIGHINVSGTAYQDGRSQGLTFYAVAKRAAGGDISLVGDPNDLTNALTATPPELFIDIDVGTQSLRFRGKGIAATQLIWNITYKTKVT